ncbi:MAG: hypothetical protein ACTIJ9_16350 [Aequorivita sp.]
MNRFLTNIKPPKYLRYFFYIVYSWYRPYKSDRADAPMMASLFLWFIHSLLALGLILNFGENLTLRYSKFEIVLPIFFAIGIVTYILFWPKIKWKKYIIEFNHFKKKDRLIGTIYLFIYYTNYSFAIEHI